MYLSINYQVLFVSLNSSNGFGPSDTVYILILYKTTTICMVLSEYNYKYIHIVRHRTLVCWFRSTLSAIASDPINPTKVPSCGKKVALPTKYLK